MLFSGGSRPRPTSKKNRRLVLAVASGCTPVELFSVLPPFLIGRVTWKGLLFAFINLIFLCIYILLDVFI